MSSLFESFLSTPEVTDALSDRAVVEAMLRFEAALARAQASVGLMGQAPAQSIIGTCKVDLFDVPKLVRESARTRCLATPLVSSLRETVALFNPEAAGLVHLGCSHQDLVDTTLTLVTRDVLKLIDTDLAQTITSLLALARHHAGDATLTRVVTQAPCATSFGLTCCQWAAPLVRSQLRLRLAATQAQSLRLGSTLTTLADMQGHGPQVMALMATDLQLSTPAFAGHTSGDEAVALACELGLLAGNLGRVATDMAHLWQFEIGELARPGEPATTVPGTKPMATVATATLCMVAQAAAQRVPQQVAVLLGNVSQPHSHAPGHWQTQLAQWPALLAACQSITHAVAQLVATLQADTRRMRSNLDAVRASLSAKDARTRFAPELLQQAADMTRAQVDTLQALHSTTPPC